MAGVSPSERLFCSDRDGAGESPVLEERVEKSYGTQLLTREGCQEELSEVPFEVLEKLQKQSHTFSRPSGKQKPVAKRPTKNHPTELSSKKPVSLFKEVPIDGSNRKHRDPRFLPSTGKFNRDKFRSDFAFLYDEQLPQEETDLKHRLKAAKDVERAELKQKLAQVQQQIHAERDRRQKLKTARKVKAEELKAVKEGKKPFYLKKSEVKKRHLIAKYESLKAEGQLERYLQKKRRRRGSKPDLAVSTFGS